MLTLVNEFTVTGDVTEFEAVLGDFNRYMSGQPGAGGYQLLRSTRRPNVFVELAEWDSAEAHPGRRAQRRLHPPGLSAPAAGRQVHSGPLPDGPDARDGR